MRTMKKSILFIAVIFLYGHLTQAQDNYSQQMQTAVGKLDQAATVKDYQQLASGFESIAQQEKTRWLYEQDGDRIEPFADKAENDIKKSRILLDTGSQKKELSEVYCVISMVNRARVFINPM